MANLQLANVRHGAGSLRDPSLYQECHLADRSAPYDCDMAAFWCPMNAHDRSRSSVATNIFVRAWRSPRPEWDRPSPVFGMQPKTRIMELQCGRSSLMRKKRIKYRRVHVRVLFEEGPRGFP
eukprot:419680-Pyramimonas_sp.AAC.2